MLFAQALAMRLIPRLSCRDPGAMPRCPRSHPSGEQPLARHRPHRTAPLPPL
jgi:hypothetical protein